MQPAYNSSGCPAKRAERVSSGNRTGSPFCKFAAQEGITPKGACHGCVNALSSQSEGISSIINTTLAEAKVRLLRCGCLMYVWQSGTRTTNPKERKLSEARYPKKEESAWRARGILHLQRTDCLTSEGASCCLGRTGRCRIVMSAQCDHASNQGNQTLIIRQILTKRTRSCPGAGRRCRPPCTSCRGAVQFSGQRSRQRQCAHLKGGTLLVMIMMMTIMTTADPGRHPAGVLKT